MNIPRDIVQSTHYDGCWRRHHECALDALASAHQRIQELEKDAARYRWLRDVAWDSPKELSMFGWWGFAAKQLDAIIDEAMAGRPFDETAE